jgi:hypothetical protein
LPSGPHLNLFPRHFHRTRRPVRPVGGNRIQRIGDGENSRAQRDVLALQSAWIAGSVPALLGILRSIL